MSEFEVVEPDDVVVLSDAGGVMVTGDPGAVDRLVQSLVSEGGAAQTLLGAVPDAAAVAAAAAAGLVTSSSAYVKFSPRAMTLLAEHGRIPTGDGFFRSFVRSDNAFAGNLDWSPASLGPERALALQQMAATWALRSAIKGVEEAVERVEGKVEQLLIFGRAERIGNVIADQRILRRLSDLVDDSGSLSETDWLTINGMGTDIERSIEAARAHLLLHATNKDGKGLTKTRLGEADSLHEAQLRETLAIIVLCEDNLALWNKLKLVRLTAREPEHFAIAVADVRHQLAAHIEADQDLLERLATTVRALTDPTGYEGLAPLRKKKLSKARDRLNADLSWFADARSLDLDLADKPSYAGFRSSVGHALQTEANAVKAVSDVVQASAQPKPTLEPGAGQQQATEKTGKAV